MQGKNTIIIDGVAHKVDLGDVFNLAASLVGRVRKLGIISELEEGKRPEDIHQIAMEIATRFAAYVDAFVDFDEYTDVWVHHSASDFGNAWVKANGFKRGPLQVEQLRSVAISLGLTIKKK